MRFGEYLKSRAKLNFSLKRVVIKFLPKIIKIDISANVLLKGTF